MKEIMSPEEMENSVFAAAKYEEGCEAEALGEVSELAQDMADKVGVDLVLLKPDGEVVAKVFPAPQTKAFSFAGLKEPATDSKAAKYEDIFGHTDFVGDPGKRND